MTTLQAEEPRFRVTCLTCKILLHEATTSPFQLVEIHARDQGADHPEYTFREYGRCYVGMAATEDHPGMPIHQVDIATGRPVPRPHIVVLCGSTRFRKAFDRANYEETMKGHIVLSVGFAVVTEFDRMAAKVRGEDLGATPAQKVALDELHKRKIDMADEVIVLNVDGYIGKSTAGEIEHAELTGKPIRWLNQPVDLCESCNYPVNVGRHESSQNDLLECEPRWVPERKTFYPPDSMG